MPHLWPYFVKTVIQHHEPFLKYNPHFPGKAISQADNLATEDKASDAPSKFLQRRMRLEAVDELVEIVGQNPYCTSKYLA